MNKDLSRNYNLNRGFDERTEEFEEELVKLTSKYDVELVKSNQEWKSDYIYIGE
jgi:hypothetical protein